MQLNPILTLTFVLWCVYAGIIIAGALTLYNKRYVGGILRALIAADAVGEDHAVTLADAGVKASFFAKRALREGSIMRKYVTIADVENVTKTVPKRGISKVLSKLFLYKSDTRTVTDFNAARMYIPFEKKDAAEIRFDRRGTNLPVMISGAVLLFGVFLALDYFTPELVELVRNAAAALIEKF